MEKVLWLIEHVKSGLRSFVLEISRWMMLHSQVDQWPNWDINWEQSELYHVGDRHTQNIQIKRWRSFAPPWLREALWWLGST